MGVERCLRFGVAGALVAGMAAGCDGEEPGETGDESFSYPLDDLLRFNHVQAVGTHNSYHQRTEGITIKEWDYEHAPLDVQLGEQGVRQFELDIWWSGTEFLVYHVPDLDENSTCDRLAECLSAMRGWSDENPAHHPIFTLLEVKDEYESAQQAETLLAALDAEIDAVWEQGRRISPDDVQGNSASLAEAVATGGWPTLGELRGRALFVLHTDGAYTSAYTEGNTTTSGRVLFPDVHGDTGLAIAATSSINDPNDPAIGVALAAGHLVRTRTDSDGTEARENDTADRDTALASGAHFLSTDFPIPHEETGYVVEMPEGTPSRCNPVTAPDECTSPSVEDPSFIHP